MGSDFLHAMNAQIPFNDRTRFVSGAGVTLFLIVFFPAGLWSQLLPPDSVDLSKVSIPEAQKSTDHSNYTEPR